MHDDEPDLDYGRFFAHPVKIEPGGPTTVTEILEAHRSLCELSSSVLRGVKSGNLGHLLYHPLWYAHKHNIPGIFRALIIVHDEYIGNDNFERNEFRKLLVDDFLEKQTVLLVRTGGESELSAPISFDDLVSVSPFNTANSPSEDLSNFDTIRVSLRTAVRFVVSLDKRETDALLASKPTAEDHDTREDNDSDELDNPRTQLEDLDALMQKGAKDGYENISLILSALRRLEAYKRGEPFEDHHEEPYRFGRYYEW